MIKEIVLLMTSTLASAAEAAFFDNVRIPMRDGVHLAGDLYLPTNRAEKTGCLLSFSPYDVTAAGKPWSPERAEAWGVATLAVVALVAFGAAPEVVVVVVEVFRDFVVGNLHAFDSLLAECGTSGGGQGSPRGGWPAPGPQGARRLDAAQAARA